VNGQRAIQIVCSCRDAYAEPRRVGFIVEVMGRSPVGAGCRLMRDKQGHGTGYRLRCDRCRRAPEVTYARWAQLVAGLDKADVDTLDIVALPF